MRYKLAAFLLVASTTLLISPAHAAMTACGNNSISNISSGAGSTPANGCGLFDLGFNNFFVGNLFNGSVPPPTASQVNLDTSGGTAGPTTTMAPIFTIFGSNNWVVNGNSSGTDCSGSCSEMSAVIAFAAAPIVTEDPPSDGGSWGISGLTFGNVVSGTATGTGIDNTSSLQLSMFFCVGVSTQAACTANNDVELIVNGTLSNGSTFTMGSVSANCLNIGANCSNAGNRISFTNPYSQGFLEEVAITLIAPNTTGSNSYNISLNSFQIEFDQADQAVPEPSSLGLMAGGSALLLVLKRGLQRRAM